MSDTSSPYRIDRSRQVAEGEVLFWSGTVGGLDLDGLIAEAREAEERFRQRASEAAGHATGVLSFIWVTAGGMEVASPRLGNAFMLGGLLEALPPETAASVSVTSEAYTTEE